MQLLDGHVLPANRVSEHLSPARKKYLGGRRIVSVDGRGGIVFIEGNDQVGVL